MVRPAMRATVTLGMLASVTRATVTPAMLTTFLLTLTPITLLTLLTLCDASARGLTTPH